MWAHEPGLDVVAGFDGVLDDEAAEPDGLVLVRLDRPDTLLTVPYLYFLAPVHLGDRYPSQLQVPSARIYPGVYPARSGRAAIETASGTGGGGGADRRWWSGGAGPARSARETLSEVAERRLIGLERPALVAQAGQVGRERLREPVSRVDEFGIDPLDHLD